MTGKIIILVYGTLRRGFGNHRYLESATFLGCQWIEGFKMINLGAFPGAIHTKDPDDMIYTEAYEVDFPTVIHCLDPLEGHPNFYTRIKIDMAFGKAWIYTLPHSWLDKDVEFIKSGRWGLSEEVA